MRYFLDFEFVEDGKTIDPISLGMISEDGRALYTQFVEANLLRAGSWVQKNVLPYLKGCPEINHSKLVLPRSDIKLNHVLTSQQARHRSGRCQITCPWETRPHVRSSVLSFCNPNLYGKPEFWGYYADYDWVALCQIFGTMQDLPEDWPMYCRDLQQWCDDLGNPPLPEQFVTEHNALSDALWNKEAWEFLRDYQEAARMMTPSIGDVS